MQIGCHLPTTQAPGATREALLTFAREAEQRGIASLWVSDHVVIPRATTGYMRGGRLGVGHVLVEFRREDLGQMLKILDLVAGTVRPAVDAA